MIPFKARLLLLICLALSAPALASAEADHSLAMHGKAKYPENFSRFDYVDPKAKKGGQLRMAVVGSFDSLNPFIVQGKVATGLGLVYQSLLIRSQDEPFSLYANLAETFQIAKDRSWISFKIDPEARFSDGSTVTARDVLFSFETLKDKGRPNHRSYYRQVTKASVINDKEVKFEFGASNNWELPLVLGLMPVLSKKFFTNNPFEKTSLSSPLGTGPYRLSSVEAGRSLTFQRNENFWARKNPAFQNRFNFDTIRFLYFRDETVAFEAFQAGLIDVWIEGNPARWNRLKSSQNIQTFEIARKNPALMRSIAFNTRRHPLNDKRIRKALTLAFDFNWMNRTFFHGLYKRTESYFDNSELKHPPLPGEAELELLLPFREELDPQLFDKPFQLPATAGDGRDRKQLKKARALLEDAGWHYKKGQLISRNDQKPLELEVLLNSSKDLRLLTSFKENLGRLGIGLKVRLMDSAGYQNRLNKFDFDMAFVQWGQSLSPGNEQHFYWSSDAARTEGSRNYPGISLNA
ncbi:MAG: extracellular solute-binding protein, partial [Sneathiellales bacterium]|nr:extracellular solute-binding protein [Sneathiellales bacterium]